MTIEQYKQRIADQFIYCLEIAASERTIERKKELMESAFGVIARIVSEANNTEVTFFTAFHSFSYIAQLRMITSRPKPKHSFAPGGVMYSETKSDLVTLRENKKEILLP